MILKKRQSVRSVLLGAVFSAFACMTAEAVEVSTVEELVQALENTQGTQEVIYLAKGEYDVSSVHMDHNPSTGVYEGPVSHLAVDCQVLCGMTDDPRDVVIYGNGTDRVLYCWCGYVYNVTISNGCAKADDKYGCGGGICGRNTATIADNVIVTCCSAPSGGGIGNVRCTRIFVENCHATATDADHGFGGGVYLPYDGYFFDGAIRNCTASNDGGGIYGVANVSNCVLSGNSAVRYGGGSYRCTVQDCVASDNSAAYGGGGFETSFVGGVVSNNTVTSSGGGLCRGTATNVCVVGNSSSGSGGGVSYANSDFGGWVVDCRIVGNRAVSDGGGCLAAILDGCVVSNNVTGCSGGGCCDCTVRDSEVVFNFLPNEQAEPSFGAGVYGGSATRCNLSGNAVAPRRAGSGGGAYSATLSDCRIADNFAPLGAAAEGCALLRCLVSNNVASADFKCYTLRLARGVTDCDLYNVQIDTPRAMVNCRVQGFGGSWTLPRGANVYTNGIFEAENTYLVYSTQDGGLAFTNCLFAGNAVSSGLIYCPTAGAAEPVPAVNCTFADNRANYTLVGFSQEAGRKFLMVNCIFEGNCTSTGDSRRDFEFALGDFMSLENCLVGTTGEEAVELVEHVGTIISDAVHFDAGNATDPYSLLRKSKARGKGIVQDWMANATDVRRDSQYPRLRDGTVDIGCYQCWLNPRVGTVLTIR